MGGGPSDLAVSGSTVFESDPSNSIDVLTVGSNCHLSIDSQNPTEGERDFDIAAVNSKTVVSADSNSNLLVAYTLQSDGKMTETTRASSQIFDPQGVAVSSTSSGLNVYTGQSTTSPPQTQGSKFKAGVFTSLKHSPQMNTDEASSNGAAARDVYPSRTSLPPSTVTINGPADCPLGQGAAVSSRVTRPQSLRAASPGGRECRATPGRHKSPGTYVVKGDL